MKKITTLLFVITIFVTAFTIPAMSQTNAKFGYINSAKLLDKLPERSKLETELDTYRKKLEDEIQSMVVEYTNKVQEYQNNEATMSDLIKQSKESEIREMEKRIQTFRQTADVDFQNKQTELFNPLLEKAQKAIEKVGDENGYTYIFDVSMGSLLYYKKGDDLQKLVEKELGIE